MNEKKRSLFGQLSLSDCLKSSSGSPSTPPVLLDSGDDDTGYGRMDSHIFQGHC